MATATDTATATATTTATTTTGGSLQLDSIPIVDLRLLSHSDLYALSLCSSSALDPRDFDDVIIPKIDRSVFNESAGSRKQTYSRIRLAPPSSSSSTTPGRRNRHHPTSATLGNINNNNSGPENAENAEMMSLFKKLFVSDVNPGELVPVKIDYSDSLPPQQVSSLPSNSISNVGLTGHKRRRGRPRRNELLGSEIESAVGVVDASDNVHVVSPLNEIVVPENLEDRDREVLNKDGVCVDFVALGAVDHPYWEEIRRRTEGLETEEELLGFMEGLEGQWGSNRKKKRIVDATEFGTALPIGWKLVLAVKKKSGRAWLYCRRYMSPSGRQFMSCKEASSYLLSLQGVQDTHPNTSAQHNAIAHNANTLTSINLQDANTATQHVDRKENVFSHTPSPAFASVSGNHEVQVILDGELQAVGVGDSVHPSSSSEFPVQDNEHVGDSKEASGNMKRVDEATDTASKLNLESNISMLAPSHDKIAWAEDNAPYPLKEPQMQNTSKSSLVALPGHASNYGENDDDEVSGRKMEVPEFDSTKFDLTSDKGEEGSFGLAENYGESKIFSNNEDMQQGLGADEATAVCVWCRSLFYEEQIQPGIIQTGAIGSLCPSCSTRIPG